MPKELFCYCLPGGPTAANGFCPTTIQNELNTMPYFTR
jgi:hypothetical protein